MSDRNDDQSVPPPPPSGEQPGGYQQPGGYGQSEQPAAYGQQDPGQPGGYQQPGGYAQPGAYQQPGAYAQPGAYGQAGYGTPPPSKTLSLISMIAGIVGVVAFGWFVPASIAALILGYMGKKREGLPAKGFWLTGIITGWVGVALTVLVVGFFVLTIALGLAAGNSYDGYDY